MISYNTLVVLLGTSLLGANAGLIGTFAVLRGRALLGDALAHAALPGLCIAFLIVGERNLPAMQLGALVTGLIGVLIVAGLRRGTRIKEDAAIGIVLSVFFGLGIVLVRMIQNQTTTGSKAGLDSYIFGKTAGMLADDVYFIAAISGGCLLLVLLLFKEFRVVSFDPGFARVQGFPTFGLDLLLTGLIAVTVVIGLPAVGVVMIAALLILPAAAARFWTDRLGRMVTCASGLGWMIGALGTALSAGYNGMPTGPVIVLVGTGMFFISAMAAPRRGVLARAAHQWTLRRRIADQGILRALYLAASEAGREGQLGIEPIARVEQCGRAQAEALLAAARGKGFVEITHSGTIRLTDEGARRAVEAMRVFQLWKLLLAEYPEQAALATDLDFEAAERKLPPEIMRELISRLDVPDLPTEGAAGTAP